MFISEIAVFVETCCYKTHPVVDPFHLHTMHNIWLVRYDISMLFHFLKLLTQWQGRTQTKLLVELWGECFVSITRDDVDYEWWRKHSWNVPLFARLWSIKRQSLSSHLHILYYNLQHPMQLIQVISNIRYTYQKGEGEKNTNVLCLKLPCLYWWFFVLETYFSIKRQILHFEI